MNFCLQTVRPGVLLRGHNRAERARNISAFQASMVESLRITKIISNLLLNCTLHIVHFHESHRRLQQFLLLLRAGIPP